MFEQSRSKFYSYAYRVLLLLLLCVAILLLLRFVIVCRITEFIFGSLNLVPMFSFSSSNRDTFLMPPLAVLSPLRPRFGYTRAW